MTECSLPLNRHGFSLHLPELDSDDSFIAAQTVPSSSLFVSCSSPLDGYQLRSFLVFGVTAFLHGARQQLSVARNIHLLKEDNCRAFLRVLRSQEIDESLIDQIARNETTNDILHSKAGPFVETIDWYFGQAVISGEGYLQHRASQLDHLSLEHDVPDIRNELQEVIARLDGSHPKPSVAKTLAIIERKYGRKTAEIVSDVALDMPLLISPLTRENFDSCRINTVDFGARFSATVDALNDLNVDSAEVSPTDLQRRLHHRVDDTSSANGGALRALDLPLLDAPTSWAEEQSIQLDSENVFSGSSLLGLVAIEAFRRGKYGAIIYRTGDDDSNWLINPWIADERGLDNSATYSRSWQLMFLTDCLIGQIVRQARSDGRITPVQCPFCRIVSGMCNADRCRCQSYVGATNRRLHEIVWALRSSNYFE